MKNYQAEVCRHQPQPSDSVRSQTRVRVDNSLHHEKTKFKNCLLPQRINIRTLFARICVGLTSPILGYVDVSAIRMASNVGLFITDITYKVHENSRMICNDVTHQTLRFHSQLLANQRQGILLKHNKYNYYKYNYYYNYYQSL